MKYSEEEIRTAAEFRAFKRLVTEVYPTGIVSIVSDTFNLWDVLTKILPKLKDIILSRDGKVVIRPDSGDPVKIMTGYKVDKFEDGWCGSECIKSDGKYYLVVSTNENREGWNIGKEISENEVKGVIQILWEIFGGTKTEKGYKLLDSHIGAIYGDAITLERCAQICQRLKEKRFASINMVYGIGSYTYQCNTRDTFGFALKSTYVVIDGQEKNIYKDPITDDGTKKSQIGRVVVEDICGVFKLIDGLDEATEKQYDNTNLLQILFEDSVLLRETSLSQIRNLLESQLP